jgi:predicted MPP superfamily phosphohydrolase
MIQENNNIQLFSKKQILLTAILSGPLSTGYVLARNFENINSTRAARISKVTGYFALFCMYIVMEVVIENYLRANVFNVNLFGAFMAVIALFLVMQLLYGGFFYLIINRLKIIRNLYSNTHIIYPRKQLFTLILLGIGSSLALITLQAFLFVFIIAIFLPAIYIFNHLKNLFKKGLYRNLFGIVFFLFAFLFPISQILNYLLPLASLKLLLWLGYLFVPFELYGFISFIIYDIITLINRGTRLFSVKHPSFPIVNKISKTLILSSIIILVAYGSYNFNQTQISHYSISIPKKNSEINHFKIAMAADFHLAEVTSEKFMDEFVEKINNLDADIILLPGDIFESYKSTLEMNSLTNKMRKIKAKYGVFGVPGNHDYYGDHEKKLELARKSGIQMIIDTAVIIDNSFVLAGRNDRHFKQRKKLENILDSIPRNLPIILMDHRPDEFETAYNNGIDIQLSGHTHYGQLFPNNFIINQIYDLGWGYKKIKNTHFFVTCGIQGWGPQVRTTGYSEIMEIEVAFQ